MTPRRRRPAAPAKRLTTIARVMRSVRSHAGCATDDQIISDLGDVSPEAVERTLASLVDVGYLEVHGERRGWARRKRPLHRLTDKGKAALADLVPTSRNGTAP